MNAGKSSQLERSMVYIHKNENLKVLSKNQEKVFTF